MIAKNTNLLVSLFHLSFHYFVSRTIWTDISTCILLYLAFKRNKNSCNSYHKAADIATTAYCNSCRFNAGMQFLVLTKQSWIDCRQMDLSLFSTHRKSQCASSQQVLSNIVIGWKFSQRAAKLSGKEPLKADGSQTDRWTIINSQTDIGQMNINKR